MKIVQDLLFHFYAIPTLADQGQQTSRRRIDVQPGVVVSSRGIFNL